MSAVFWLVTIVMAVLAFSFVATPLRNDFRRPRVVAMAIAMPLFAASMYWFIGSPQAADVEPMSAHDRPITTPTKRKPSDKSVGSVASMVDGLASRLQDNPDDGKSWLLLARSFEHLNRMPEAKAAYEKAAALGEYDGDPGALTNLSDTPAMSAAQVAGNVRLSERAMEIVKPTDTVFIFARAVGGPPMPVAALQRPAADLPLDFVLDDLQAMSADAMLSSFEHVTVSARISRSGAATDALRGLEAQSETIAVADNRHINLIIE